MAAIRQSLNDAVGWTYSHSTGREAIEATLTSAGVRKYVVLPYAHKAGIAANLNEWVYEQAGASDRLIPFAMVHPEDDDGRIVRNTFESRACGLKIHCSVQNYLPADPRIEDALEVVAEFDR